LDNNPLQRLPLRRKQEGKKKVLPTTIRTERIKNTPDEDL